MGDQFLCADADEHILNICWIIPLKVDQALPGVFRAFFKILAFHIVSHLLLSGYSLHC